MSSEERFSTRGRGILALHGGGVGRVTPAPATRTRSTSVGARATVRPSHWKPARGPLVAHAQRTVPYERQADDPLTRPVRIYALDPSATARQGRDAVVHVPFEMLTPGPAGSVIAVVGRDGGALDLDQPAMTLGSGRPVSPADPAFRQQMAYAVAMGVYEEFRGALGRDIGWGFRLTGRKSNMVLKLLVDVLEQQNAHYDSARGEIVFGCFQSVDRPGGLNLSRGRVHTALSHDIITHEVTHAILDGLRPNYIAATAPDAVAFHEALADLIALFRKFSYATVVKSALAATRGKLSGDSWLTAIARQFGDTTGLGGPLRSVLTPGLNYRTATDEPHERCQVLVAAVWQAFEAVFERKIARYVRAATNGRGVLPEGDLPADLQELLVAQAHKLARNFLQVVIRAIDYCPPVDIEFGEFLRALLTADRALVPDDVWGYREAFIEAFRAYDIEPRDVEYLAEDALLWKAPVIGGGPIAKLDFGSIRFRGDPGRPVEGYALDDQVNALWHHVTEPEFAAEFGLVLSAEPGEEIDVPRVDSLRTTRRIGPSGQIVFDLVAEITQRRVVRFGNERMEFIGGSTVLIDPYGQVRYAIRKGVHNQERLLRQLRYATSEAGGKFWNLDKGTYRPVQSFYKLLDDKRTH